jgi:hypothetical protein
MFGIVTLVEGDDETGPGLLQTIQLKLQEKREVSRREWTKSDDKREEKKGEGQESKAQQTKALIKRKYAFSYFGDNLTA